MKDTLERERQVNNLIDQVARLQKRVERLEEQLRLAAAGTESVIVRNTETGQRYMLYVEDLGEDWPALLMAEV